MANYKISPEAKEDLFRIYRWGIRKHGEEVADEYYSAFFDHFEQLAEKPLLYPAVNHIHKGYRRSVCGVDSVYYRVEDQTVEIMAIIGRQDTQKWL